MVSHEGYLPLYERIAQDIANQIDSGLVKPGDKLPSERELCDRYQVSQITVRRALRELRYAGRLISRHGMGWYVIEKPVALANQYDVVLFTPDPDWLVGGLVARILLGLEAANLAVRVAFQEPDNANASAYGDVREGIVIVGEERVAAPYVAALQEKETPTLLVLREIEGVTLPGAVLDEEECAAMATRHLLDLGHRRIAYVGGDSATLGSARRYAGFAQALWSHGLELVLDWVWTGGLPRSSDARLRGILAGREGPSAVVCEDDLWAAATMNLLAELQRRCPGDIAMVSLGDRDFAPLLSTSLSSFRFDIGAISQAVVTMARDLLASKEAETVRFTGQMIVRESCGSALPPPR